MRQSTTHAGCWLGLSAAYDDSVVRKAARASSSPALSQCAPFPTSSLFFSSLPRSQASAHAQLRLAEMPVFKCATVCASNMNRSMEGHKQLYQSGFKVSSYGVGRMVIIFGPHCALNVSSSPTLHFAGLTSQ